MSPLGVGLARELIATLRSNSDEARVLRAELASILAPELRPAPAHADELLGATAVARRLDLSRRALDERFRRARLRGEPHLLEQLALYVDGHRRWRRTDIETFIASHAGATQ